MDVGVTVDGADAFTLSGQSVARGRRNAGAQAIEACGDEGFVFSTDYPHYDTKYSEATARFLKLPIAEASKGRILEDNCARLDRIGAP